MPSVVPAENVRQTQVARAQARAEALRQLQRLIDDLPLQQQLKQSFTRLHEAFAWRRDIVGAGRAVQALTALEALCRATAERMEQLTKVLHDPSALAS